MIKKYKFFAFSDLDIEGDDGSETYVLNLPYGYRIRGDVLEHRKGFSSMSDLRKFARTDVVPCGCKVCRS